MKSIFNKTNAPYLVAGTLATLTSLIPGAMFIASPFLFSCASYFIGIIAGCAVVSTIIITVLLCAVISKNNTISGQEEKENTELKTQPTRRNAPYLVAGTLAALASLIPGAMVIAPVLIFNPPCFTGVIIGCAVFSAIIITVLLHAVISRNNTISEQNAKIAELKNQLHAVISRNNTISEQNAEIAELKDQLHAVISKKDNTISEQKEGSAETPGRKTELAIEPEKVQKECDISMT